MQASSKPGKNKADSPLSSAPWAAGRAGHPAAEDLEIVPQPCSPGPVQARDSKLDPVPVSRHPWR